MPDTMLGKIEKSKFAFDAFNDTVRTEPVNATGSSAYREWSKNQSKLGDLDARAFLDVIRTTPTTRQGAIALIDWYIQHDGPFFDDPGNPHLRTVLKRLRAFLRSAS